MDAQQNQETIVYQSFHRQNLEFDNYNNDEEEEERDVIVEEIDDSQMIEE